MFPIGARRGDERKRSADLHMGQGNEGAPLRAIPLDVEETSALVAHAGYVLHNLLGLVLSCARKQFGVKAISNGVEALVAAIRSRVLRR
jgi:hypothetical protein